MNLNDNPTKYQVKIGSRIISEQASRTAAEFVLGQLTESERAQAVIVPVAANGGQVLLG